MTGRQRARFAAASLRRSRADLVRRTLRPSPLAGAGAFGVVDTLAANDTAEPTTLTRGTSLQSTAWRVKRLHGQIEITDLRSAGKRGRTCSEFLVIAYGSNEAGESALDLVAPFILEAVRGDVSIETMARALADVGLCGDILKLQRHELRGCDVDREPVLRFDADDVRARFDMREFVVTFTATLTRPLDGTTFRYDTSVRHASRKDAARAYAWAQSNRHALAGMTYNDFILAMGAIGVQCS